VRAADRSGQYKLVSVISVTILITVMSWLHGWAAKSTSTSVLALQAEAQVTVVPRTTPTAPQTVAPSTQMTTPLPTQTATPSPAPTVLSSPYLQRFVKALISPEALVETVASLLVTVILAWAYVLLWPLIRARFIGDEVKRREDTPQYAKTMQELSSELVSSFEKVDRLIEGMQSYMTDRRKALDSLEIGTRRLEEREIELKERIATLEKVPIEALDYFIEATESAERRATRRDYYLFFAGLIGGTILSTIVSLLIGSFGLF